MIPKYYLCCLIWVALISLVLFQLSLSLQVVIIDGYSNNNASFSKPNVNQHSTTTQANNNTTIVTNINTTKNTLGNQHKTITLNNKTPHRKWAYAFLISGIDPNDPTTFQVFFYNVLVSAFILRQQHHSVADIILMVQISKFSNATILQHEEIQLLNHFNIIVVYLPPPIRQNFYVAQFEKFRILQFTNYSRILYLDSDVMPFCNLDYMFELSEPDIELKNNENNKFIDDQYFTFQENVILAWEKDASHGGFFLLTPKEGDYDKIQQIIAKREQEALTLPYPHFNETIGFGHVIQDGDYIQNFIGEKLYKWKWHGVFADQGLLYHWTKYVKQQVTIIIGTKIEQWVPPPPPPPPLSNQSTILTTTTTSKTTPILQATYKTKKVLGNYTCLPQSAEGPYRWGNNKQQFLGLPPYRDFRHFTGRTKPFLVDKIPSICANGTLDNCDSAGSYWWMILRQLKASLNISKLNLKDWNTKRDKFFGKQAPLGGHPTYKSLVKTIQARDRLAKKDQRLAKQQKG